MAGRLVLSNTAAAPLRARYNATNYADFTVSSAGDLTIAPTGGDTAITGNLSISGAITGTLSLGASTVTANIDLLRSVTGAAIAGTVRVNVGGTLTDRLTYRGGYTQLSGILTVGTSVVGAAADGDVVVSGTIRGLDSAGGTDYRLLSYTQSSGRIYLGLNAGPIGIGTSDLLGTSAGDARLAGAFWLKDGLAAPSASTGWAALYVDSVDGDLKIRFGDGVTKTIALDT